MSWADIACSPKPAPAATPEPAAAPTAALCRGPCAGLSLVLCRHCRCTLAAHEGGEEQCSARRQPNVAVWTAYAAKQPHLTPKRETRAAPGGAVAAPHAGGRVQRGGRTPEQQDAYRAEYKRWHSRAQYELDAEASARLADYVGVLLQPLAPSSTSGEFSDYEKLRLEFTSLLSRKVKPELLDSGDTSKLNNSALQLFARELREADAFREDGVAAARMPGEQSDGDFALQHARYVLVPAYREALNEKLVFWSVQLRRRHHSLTRVKALDAGVSLMEVYDAVTTSPSATRASASEEGLRGST